MRFLQQTVDPTSDNVIGESGVNILASVFFTQHIVEEEGVVVGGVEQLDSLQDSLELRAQRWRSRVRQRAEQSGRSRPKGRDELVRYLIERGISPVLIVLLLVGKFACQIVWWTNLLNRQSKSHEGVGVGAVCQVQQCPVLHSASLKVHTTRTKSNAKKRAHLLNINGFFLTN